MTSTRRAWVPVLPTAIVTLAVAAMVALGLWQLLVRLPEKEAQLAQLARNPALAMIAFPDRPDDRLLFRRATTDCAPPVQIDRAGAGNAGFRLIARCGSGALVQLGTTRDPLAKSDWAGGRVTGWISHAPDAQPLIVRAFARAPQALLLIADTPAPGLTANARPDPAIVPNNHLAYAVQWFFFAGVAAIIYVLALRRSRS